MKGLTRRRGDAEFSLVVMAVLAAFAKSYGGRVSSNLPAEAESVGGTLPSSWRAKRAETDSLHSRGRDEELRIVLRDLRASA